MCFLKSNAVVRFRIQPTGIHTPRLRHSTNSTCVFGQLPQLHQLLEAFIGSIQPIFLPRSLPSIRSQNTAERAGPAIRHCGWEKVAKAVQLPNKVDCSSFCCADAATT